uniref:aldehyde dehydrogenase family protein n=1 Tax=Sphingomonas bacterium TaxID=1895847 RepID=UPI00157638CB
MVDVSMLIDGRLVEGHGRIDVINPALGAPFATSPVASPAQLDEAVAAAKAAFAGWSATPLAE